jgi:hypothetical protein
VTTLDDIEAALFATVSGAFGVVLPPETVEARLRWRVDQDALADDESLPLEDRFEAAFRCNSDQRPLQYLRLFKKAWGPFRDPAVAARVLVENWSGFDAIPHHWFVELVFPRLSNEELMGAMSADARAFLAGLPNPFLAWRGQDAGKQLGLSWTLDPTTAADFARGHRSIWNPRPAVYRASIAKVHVAFACVDRDETEVTLRLPPLLNECEVTLMRRPPRSERRSPS